jgi:hypothetical protein
MQREDGSHMYYAPVPEDIDTLLLLSIEQAISRILRPIYAFIRLNTSRHDTEFRIHSDSKVCNHMPTVAALFYLDGSDTEGTAFYKHSELGDRALNDDYHLYTTDDGKWTRYETHYPKENSLIVYDSKLFHGRYPWKVEGINQKDGRIVVVKFLKDVI